MFFERLLNILMNHEFILNLFEHSLNIHPTYFQYYLRSTRPLDRISRPSMYSTRREVDFVTCRNLVVMGSNPTVNKNSKVVVLMKDSSSPTHSYPGTERQFL